LRPLYRRYLQSRINTFEYYDDWQRSNSYFQQSVKFQDQIWDIASASVLQDKNPGIISLVLGSTGDMMDVANERLQATRTHPPIIVYSLLFALALASAFMVGQDMSVNKKRPLFYMIIFCATISLIAFIISDLENLRVGLTRINIQSDKVLVETLEIMNWFSRCLLGQKMPWWNPWIRKPTGCCCHQRVERVANDQASWIESKCSSSSGWGWP
jgi:hypothetical protein